MCRKFAGPRAQGMLDIHIFAGLATRVCQILRNGKGGNKKRNFPNREKRQRATKQEQKGNRLKNARHSLKGGSVPGFVLRSPGALPPVPICPPSIRVGPRRDTVSSMVLHTRVCLCHGILPV